jgi:hypothetical protein
MLKRFYDESLKKTASWETMFVFCLLLTISQLVMIASSEDYSISPFWFKMRICHMILSSTGFIYVILMRKKWTTHKSEILFVLLYSPFYIFSWFFHSDASLAGQVWIPLKNFWYHFFVLGIIVPGSYLINFLLLLGFVIESIVVWFYFDLSHLSGAVLNAEPAATFLFAFLAVVLLVLRFRDEQKIFRLYLEQERGKFFEKVIRFILSVRDKTNTPLQTLSISIDLMKKDPNHDPETIAIMENAITKIVFFAEMIKEGSGAHLESKSFDLMTSEEMVAWFDEIKRRGQGN